MEKEAAIAQASAKPAKSSCVKVQIYTPAHVCTASVYCPYHRLLDLLNGVLMAAYKEFIPVSEVEVRSPDRGEAKLQSAYINRANILFVREIEDGETKGLGGQGGHKPYPFVAKWSAAVKVYMPFYTLNGQVHYPKERRVVDVLNSGMKFLAMTNVQICSSAGSSESGVSFIAVNKEQILSLEELGIPLIGGARTTIVSPKQDGQEWLPKLTGKVSLGTTAVLLRAYSAGCLTKPIEECTDEELIVIRGIGKKTLADIRRALRSNSI